MPQRLHIIITGETGEGRAFAVHKKTVRRFVALTLLLAVFLTAGTMASFRFFQKNQTLAMRSENLDSRLARTSATLAEIRSERDRLARDRKKLLEGSISRLDERSKAIQEIMDYIGVDIEVSENPEHSGGPLLAPKMQYSRQLLERTDHYLEVLRKIPLGRPVPGSISSGYGNRIDPLAKKKSFHPGIDFRGHTGDPIKATADGIVKKASRNSILGRHVILLHGNGFETIFAHMHKTLVSKGDKVTRGQVIGLIGNTGRSTGSHLHYTMRYQGKTIDPTKYLQVADLNLTVQK
jgi:murein DD-endopeptidase MepM/ murein hydrolase activator NlpD